MSAQASGSDDKKLNKASKCEKCGNRHEGACWPKCGTCGKIHRGACRYAQAIPTVNTGKAGREPSQAELTARLNAQQVGYQQAYNDIQSSILGPGMVSGMCGQIFGPFGGFGSQYPGQYRGFGALGNPGWVTQGWGTQGWGMQIPGQFGQGFGGFPTPPMGHGTVDLFGYGGGPARNYAGNKQGIGGPRDNRKPQSKEEHKDKKEEKSPLGAKSTGIEKPISKSAKQRARKRLIQKKKKKEDEEKEDEEKHAQDALTGPGDLELIRLLDESKTHRA